MTAILPELLKLRTAFLTKLKAEVLCEKTDKEGKKTNNLADTSSRGSSAIAAKWGESIPGAYGTQAAEQTSGKKFDEAVADFLKRGFTLFSGFRPGDWSWQAEPIYQSDQYQHLAEVMAALKDRPELKTVFCEGYLIKPDIVVRKVPVTPSALGGRSGDVALYSPFVQDAQLAHGKPTLHASISCKLTLRSDRAQNVRTEALNLIRNRKGRTPIFVAVVAEPTPHRMASLALGTGDLDCVYHAGLYELQRAVKEVGSEEQGELLGDMVNGRRLRDLSDLVLDLAI